MGFKTTEEIKDDVTGCVYPVGAILTFHGVPRAIRKDSKTFTIIGQYDLYWNESAYAANKRPMKQRIQINVTITPEEYDTAVPIKLLYAELKKKYPKTTDYNPAPPEPEPDEKKNE